MVKKGRSPFYFARNPNSRRKLPPHTVIHCYAVSAAAATRLAAIFNQDLTLRFFSGTSGVRHPSPGGSAENSGHASDT